MVELVVNELQLYSAILTSGHSKSFTICPNIHPFMHTFTAESTTIAVRSVAVRVRCFAQGQHDALLGGAGDRTSNLPVTSQPTLPPEPHASLMYPRIAYRVIIFCGHRIVGRTAAADPPSKH